MVKNTIGLMAIMVMLNACQHVHLPWLQDEKQYQKQIVIEQPKEEPEVQSYYNEAVQDVSKLMTHENVIVYPVDEPITGKQMKFPEDRRSGKGYVAFDPSVEVYALDDMGGPVPGYMPDYAVPQYSSGPINVARRPSPSQSYSTLSSGGNPADVTQVPLAPMKVQNVPSRPNSQAGRRSGPVLTGY